jgi:hypothetical protein
MPKKKMNPLSFDLGNALLVRHQRLCKGFTGSAETVPDELIRKATIAYKPLLLSIGAPGSLAEGIGTYLGEVAEWCDARGLPPINALAINGELGMPGTGYFLAAGATANWEIDVRKCIACKNYPSRISN